jgi:IS30 family transposase
MLEAGCTRKDICITIGKDKSVLSRELQRNSHKRGYSPRLAQEEAEERKRFANLTVTERKTGFLLIKKLPKGKNAKDLAMELF